MPRRSSRIETPWHRIALAVPPAAVTFAHKLYESFYRQDVQRSRLFMIGAVLAVGIGCIGLYGLAAIDTARRVKEIGIRKTLGASTTDVLRLLIGQFLKPVLIATMIAVPLAYYAMEQWLAGFDDRVALSPWLLVGAVALVTSIAVATILGQTLRVAQRTRPGPAISMNPLHSSTQSRLAAVLGARTMRLAGGSRSNMCRKTSGSQES